METLAIFQEQRGRLFGLAYRLLGDAAEAEDVVQDAYLKWEARATADVPVRTASAWLAKAVTNLCLNRLTAARATREQYVGPWLPTPVRTADLGPLETVEQRETVTLAMLLLLERLTPPERAVFVLRAAFEYRYREIADLLDREEADVRQLYHRASTHIAQHRRRFPVDPDRHAEIVGRFFAAAGRGAVGELAAALADEVTAWADGGGRISVARRPIHGRAAVARYFAAFGLNPRAAGIELVPASVNGVPAMLAPQDGVVRAALVVELDGELITGIYSIVNPDKLTHVFNRGADPATEDGAAPRRQR
ncbi:RNA polymerase sigma factor SigJ [Nocardia arthritidis]|uniref:Sigma-70 family RNA polymerase sigma factor n=1 Tax=Nocardia arthritidis TaxID=228602 RepID=A0A6G9YBC5_9NOCA|nr:RNA polymerase sigma factor SigJ [Nocardia arthritidis]QIS10333.1 sigma-70 family RNA polymerase sigma factor [Nocardia arthritidis]